MQFITPPESFDAFTAARGIVPRQHVRAALANQTQHQERSIGRVAHDHSVFWKARQDFFEQRQFGTQVGTDGQVQHGSAAGIDEHNHSRQRRTAVAYGIA